jgi:biopolymer transport protein ExbB/TolQ
MFENKSLLDILHMGGWVMYVLLACSVLSVAVFIAKEIEFRKKSKPSRNTVMDIVRALLEGRNIEKALEYCRAMPYSIYCRVIAAALAYQAKNMREAEDAAYREIGVEIARLERNTAIVGTIANVAVYIGLFGTVLGIVNAFHGITSSASAGLNAVIGGVAEALINTAAGLGVAIPAVIFYNVITRQVKGFTQQMDATASEVMTILDSHEQRR